MELVEKIKSVIIQPIISLLFALALVVFLFGVTEYILGATSSEKRITGTKHIAWGLIGMAIMAMAYGILVVIKNTIGA